MKKENIVKTVIAVVALCLLIVGIVLFYNKTNKDFEELKNNINNINSELFNIHQENAKILDKLNLQQINDNE